MFGAFSAKWPVLSGAKAPAAFDYPECWLADLDCGAGPIRAARARVEVLLAAAVSNSPGWWKRALRPGMDLRHWMVPAAAAMLTPVGEDRARL